MKSTRGKRVFALRDKAVLLLSQSNFRDYKLCLIPKDDNTVSRRPAFATGRLETELTPCPAL